METVCVNLMRVCGYLFNGESLLCIQLLSLSIEQKGFTHWVVYCGEGLCL